MSYFKGLKLTKLGETLLANINGNLNETLTFTSGEIGAGTINGDDEIRFLTSLKEKWKDLDIISIEKDPSDETIVKLELQFSNIDLKEAKIFREIGIYAKGNNGEPILFAYSNAGENYDYIPLPQDNPQNFTIEINLKITSNSKIDAIINMAGFVTIGKMLEFLKNKLTQIPTIAELQSRKNLKVGDIVEVLGYYSAGDGAGHKRVIANEDDGSGVQLSNKLWANIVHNGEVNVSWFGAKGDGITDDTEIIRKVIKFMYSSVEQKGWRRETVIKFPIGTFIINGSIIDANLGVSAGRFTFSGNGMASTVIKFTGTLFDNQQIFGFTQFEKMQFISDNTGTFMNFVGGGSGNAQGLNFNLCRFGSIKTIINASGGTMSSEVTFSQCRIAEFNETSIMFILNNAQGVNWRFIATDIESFSGICFQYLKGSAVSVFHGSIIPYSNGKVIEIPRAANSNDFAGGNNPIISFYSSRFEMRDFSKLIHKQSLNVYFSAVFENCGMGGYNLQNYGIEHYPIDIYGDGKVIFRSCEGFNKYRMKHTTATVNGIAPNIIFENCDMTLNDLSLFLSNSFLDGATYNDFRYAQVDWNGVIFSGTYYETKKSKKTLTLTNGFEIKNANNNNNVVEIFSKNICGKTLFVLPIREVIVTNYGRYGYGNPDLKFTLYNEDKTKVLASETIKFETKKSYKYQVVETVKGFVLEVSTTSGYDNIPYFPLNIEVI